MFAVLMALALIQPALADTKFWPEPKEQKDARMEWWREARFGMFIHWGLYAIPAGEWEGKPVNGIGEWIMNRGRITKADYAPLQQQFNPVKYDADEWVRIAKQAGMKYIVITSKHHDGFCLWDSEHTEFDMMNTPYGKDLLAPLKEACDKHGVKLCFYHSIMDWTHPDYAPLPGWDKDREGHRGDYEKYVEYMKAQCAELIEKYDPEVMWYDGEWERTWTHEHGKMLYDFIRERKPSILINNRVDKGRRGMAGMTRDGGYRGDFGTPEQEIPEKGLPGVDWETCMTMNGTWGYKSSDHNWKSEEDLIRKLIDIASKGGNFLLNVGPTSEGEIPQPSIERLAAMGEWMAVNGESIYGTTASPFGKVPFGRVTHKADEKILYLHVFGNPGKTIELPGMGSKVAQLTSLSNGDPVAFEQSETDPLITITLPPSEQIHPIATVLKMSYTGELIAEEFKPVVRKNADAGYTCEAKLAEVSGERLRYRATDDTLCFWSDPADQPKWTLRMDESGLYDVYVTYSCNAGTGGSHVDFAIDGEKLPFRAASTGSWEKYNTVKIGSAHIQEAGEVELVAIPANREPVEGIMNLRSVELKPAPFELYSETPAERDARMEWWRDARFGMFVHWGLYSNAAGVWDGKEYWGGVEWIQHLARVKPAEYADTLMPQFQPKEGFADEWMQTAKAAGMKYVVFTNKHHEGFALHDSQATTYDAKDACGRDIHKEIIDAARRAGLKIGFYHSVIDWHHPDFPVGHTGLPHPLQGHPGRSDETRDLTRYADYLHQQVDELVSNYGPIDVIWWDYSNMPIQGEAWRSRELMALVREKQPNVIMNNRLYRIPEAGWSADWRTGKQVIDPQYGDFTTPEQHIPATGAPGVDWETCMTMNGTWGYSAHDQRWKSTEQLTRNLIDIVSKGGNYLLNIGPKGDGGVPEPSVERLREMGEWLKVNGEAIYGCGANPLGKVEWGRITSKDDALYLHVFGKPEDGVITVPLIADGEPKVGLLDGSALNYMIRDTGVEINVAGVAFDGPATVIKFVGKGEPILGIAQSRDGSLTLNVAAATLHAPLRLEQKDGKRDNIGFWLDVKGYAEWDAHIHKPGRFKVQLDVACESGSEGAAVTLSCGDSTVETTIPNTGGWEKFQTIDMGEINIGSKGKQTLKLKAKSNPGLAVGNVALVRLTPVE